jgi:site-specific DNA-methyltransferase (adenine-specific)
VTILRREVIGNQTLILGDCLQVMPLLGRFDAVVTDVPYGISQESKGLRRLDYGTWDGADATPVALDALTMCAETPSIVAWCGWRQLKAIADALPGRSERPLTWAKPNPPVLNGQSLFLSSTEHAFYGKLPAAWFLGGCIKSYWVGRAPVAREHPTQKPDWLMEACVAATVPPGGTCLDCFMGSGTTLVACQRMGRAGTGIELDPDYFDIACRRVDEAARQPDLFIAPDAKPVQDNLFGGDK